MIGVNGVAGVRGDLSTALGCVIGTVLAFPSENVDEMSEAAKVRAESFDMTENTRWRSCVSRKLLHVLAVSTSEDRRFMGRSLVGPGGREDRLLSLDSTLRSNRF